MKTLSSKPVHVDSADDDLLARVAAIDVAKDSGMACTRVPDESRPGKRATTVWSIRARTSSINELADQLAEQGIERVVLEATSDYGRPFYYLLEARGLTVWLVNAREVKNVPGRPKTEKTSLTLSGWPSSTSAGCSGLRSCHRSRSVNYATTPGFGLT
jgi:transposase